MQYALVFSDSHRVQEPIRALLALFEKQIAAAIHLGDFAGDLLGLQPEFPKLPMYAVQGNCREGGDFDTERIVSLGGKKILITHGHLQHVKYSTDRLAYYAQEREADACLFGHTHEPDVFRAGETLFVNPGSIGFPHSPCKPTYGVLDIDKNGIDAGIVEIYAENKFRSWLSG